jgi:hypothetical protein
MRQYAPPVCRRIPSSCPDELMRLTLPSQEVAMKRIVLLVLVFCCSALAQCTTDSVAGTYAVSYIGWVTMVMPDLSMETASGGIVGIISVKSDGTVAGKASVAGFGPVTDYAVAGTVEIKSNCTGTIRLTGQSAAGGGPPMLEVDRFVLLPPGNELLVIITDMGPGVYPAVIGTWKRMSFLPNFAAW